MSVEKFLIDDVDEVKIPEKNYKSKVNDVLKTKFEDEDIKLNSLNLLNMNANKTESPKKIQMSLYFEESDLLLLKAISQNNNTTVNKTVMSILEGPLSVTRDNLPSDFNIEKLAKEYDKNSKKKKRK